MLRDEAKPRAALGSAGASFSESVIGSKDFPTQLLVPPAAFLWMVPFALVGLPIVLAFFTGAIAWGTVRLGA